MPELPEVETVARDLRPRIVGADDRRRARLVAADLRTHDAERVRRASRAGGSSRSAGGRKLVVIELSGDAALTIHLKMTGQLFVVRPGRPEDPYVRLVLELHRRARPALPRHPQVRAGRPSTAASRGSGELVRVDVGTAVVRRARAGAARSGVHRASVPDAACEPAAGGSSRSCSTSRSWPGSATSTPTRRSGRRGSTRSGRTASLRPADERRLYRAIRAILAEAVERRGSSIDDYTAPDGDGSMQERLHVYQRTGEPCPRCGRPIRRDRDRRSGDPLLLVVPAPAGGRPTRHGGDPPAATGRTARAGGRWTTLAGRSTGTVIGLTGTEAEQAAAGGPGAHRPHSPRGGDPTGGGPERRSAAAPATDVDPPPRPAIRREVGTFVILDDVDAVDRARRPGRPRRPERSRQDDAPPDRRRPRRARRRRGPAEARAEPRPARPGVPLRRRLHGRAGPADGRPGRAPPHLERMEQELPELEQAHRVDGARLRTSSSTSSRSSAATPSTSGSTRRCRDSASTADEWTKPPAALSGGEQTRAALARLVIADPDLLLLDEPTNHLDIAALEWLEEHLRRRSGSLLVASHDRAFLDATVDPDLGAP